MRGTGAEPLYCKYVIGLRRGPSLEEAGVEIDLFIIYSFHLAIDREAGLSDLALCHDACLPLR